MWFVGLDCLHFIFLHTIILEHCLGMQVDKQSGRGSERKRGGGPSVSACKASTRSHSLSDQLGEGSIWSDAPSKRVSKWA